MKYLFIGGPLDQQYVEASGNHHETFYAPPLFTIYESAETKSSGRTHNYLLRLVTLGITDLPVYVAAVLSDAEILRLILTAYHQSER